MNGSGKRDEATDKVAWIRKYFRSLRNKFRATRLESFLTGFVFAVLLLKAGADPKNVTLTFLWALIVIIAIWFFIRERKSDRFSSDQSQGGLFIFLALGYAAGALIYFYRDRVEWLWGQLSKIDTDTERLLAALFVFGLIMGVYVVRNWSKGQEEFTKGVLAAVGGALLTPLLGNADPGSLSTFRAFIFYFSGFVLSAGLNLIYASRLIANYTNERSLISRARLAFLYGSDKAEEIDAQFLKNFDKDPDDARRLLVEALTKYKERIKRGFAQKARSRYAQKMRTRDDQDPELKYYQLISIEGTGGAQSPANAPPSSPPPQPGSAPLPGSAPQPGPAPKASDLYTVNYRSINDKTEITPDMFRIAISVKWQDHLEYIDDRARWKTFPLLGSVAGLALEARRTIVMDRDKTVVFRTPDYLNGLTPEKIEQKRGLDEIAFLSYIAIPVVAELGNLSDTPLGILHVDTKLFAADKDDEDLNLDPSPGEHKAQLKLDRLTKMANNLYDYNDKGVAYLEDARSVIVPLLTLYLRCRQGSS